MSNLIIKPVKDLSDALEKLNEHVFLPADHFDHKTVIQRFQYVVDLLLKLLKSFSDQKGLIARVPAEFIQNASKFGLIQRKDIYLEMVQVRNELLVSNEGKISDTLLNRIKYIYLKEIKQLINFALNKSAI